MSNFYNKIRLKYKISYNSRFILEHFLGLIHKSKFIDKWASQNFKSTQNYIIQNLPKVGEIGVDSFEDLSSKEFYRNYYRKGFPVVFKNKASTWQACHEWGFDFFQEKYSDAPVLLANHKALDEKANNIPEISTLGEVIKEIKQGSDKYIRFNPLLDRYPELQDCLDQKWIKNLLKRKPPMHTLFIGKKGTKTKIHNAGNENLFVQIIGRKLWYLWDPQAMYILNPEVNRSPGKHCELNPTNPDLQKYPAYSYLPTHKIILNPGDIMYIPSYWWHYVENLDLSLAVGMRWTDPMITLHNSKLLSIMDTFDTNPNILKALFDRDKTGVYDFNKLLAEAKK